MTGEGGDGGRGGGLRFELPGGVEGDEERGLPAKTPRVRIINYG